MTTVSVAILGAGRIAQSMAATIRAMMTDPRYSNLVSLYAIASRDGDRAREFADRYSIPVSYGSYGELLADPHVDLVYIATPHSLHTASRSGRNPRSASAGTTCTRPPATAVDPSYCG